MPLPETREPSMFFLVQRAREMRKQATPSEVILWEKLRHGRLGVRFRRQHPVPPYILDFYAAEVLLAIEVDGAGHSEARDARRDAWLARSGIRVLRVKAWLVERRVSVVLDAIRAAL